MFRYSPRKIPVTFLSKINSLQILEFCGLILGEIALKNCAKSFDKQ